MDGPLLSLNEITLLVLSGVVMVVFLIVSALRETSAGERRPLWNRIFSRRQKDSGNASSKKPSDEKSSRKQDRRAA